MCELVDERDGRLAQQHRVEVHLLKNVAAIVDAPAGDNLQPL